MYVIECVGCGDDRGFVHARVFFSMFVKSFRSEGLAWRPELDQRLNFSDGNVLQGTDEARTQEVLARLDEACATRREETPLNKAKIPGCARARDRHRWMRRNERFVPYRSSHSTAPVPFCSRPRREKSTVSREAVRSRHAVVGLPRPCPDSNGDDDADSRRQARTTSIATAVRTRAATRGQLGGDKHRREG